MPPEEPSPPAVRPLLTRRRFLAMTAGCLALGGAGYPLAVISPPPRLADLTLSDAALALIREAWVGLDPAKVLDVHCHVIGLGVGGTGCFVHPDSLSYLSPLRKLKTRIYKGAAGVHDDARADALFVERLVDLVTHQSPRVRAVLLPFDKHFKPDGTEDLARTEFHTPNDYVLGLAEQHPDLFLPGCSVHPYRADALDELTRCQERGARLCKWLPNAMGMDPADPRCDAFYERLAALGMPLLSHAGEEQAVHAEEAQELGNPLRLRRALERGVTVIVAHCASLGACEDLDAPADAAGKRPKASCYSLFRRLLTEERWNGRLFGDVSAMTQFNRCGVALPDVLGSPEVHGRLLNGSDYPLPAIDPLIRTGLLVEQGLLDAAERPAINELFAYNPLTFDFVLKRRLRRVGPDGDVQRFGDAVFETARVLGA
ncbi:MAG: amidohydrolase family protein [Planctomycetes bacterium]|nr:amidohydrolase family protein [Planctomycetota bacterium]